MSVPSSLVPGFTSSFPQLFEMVNSHLQNISFVSSSVGVGSGQDFTESIDTGVDASSSAAFYQRFREFANLEEGVRVVYYSLTAV